ncbi:MAG: YeeE/YedE family protein [Deltaproteobacteria bacterium]|nr:MAG: YeeE/YedE family protein [Deltaproteobacteria bacterium]
MRHTIVAFLSGLLFAIGLGISGMTNPSKVIGFLDFAGSWDPSLAFVMGGALLVNVIAFRLIMRRRSPLFAPSFSLPTRNDIDAPLVGGAALFGIGWGLGGFCPGPGLASAATLHVMPLVFVGAMTVGMLVYGLVMDRRAAASSPPGAVS